jgi:hypothetical protein
LTALQQHHPQAAALQHLQAFPATSLMQRQAAQQQCLQEQVLQKKM